MTKDTYQKIDRSSERLIKLNPYSIVDTDPTLDNFNISNTLGIQIFPLFIISLFI